MNVCLPHNTRAWLASLALAPLLFGTSASHAALTVNGTRVVYDSAKRSVSMIVNNPSQVPYAVQSWVNTVTDDTQTPVPFVVHPPLFRLEPGASQQVQISGLPNELPRDRESLFYFNVQEIPKASDGENTLTIALRTRIKLFYRPAELNNDPVKAYPTLTWRLDNSRQPAELEVYNPTPYHVSFLRIDIENNAHSQHLNSPAMVEPFARQRYALPGYRPGGKPQVRFRAINDYGGYTPVGPLAVTLTP
ncbi:molecular chaperone [Pseudomonas sp. nanlin1]|uniref:fimbrial biogenesis chaperone n=1 Tax=Pseudomonas sp. nanlin1 TaxID=3040605 RepID=UPI00388E1E71